MCPCIYLGAVADEILKVKSEVKEPTHKAFYKQAEKLRRTFLAEETENELLDSEKKKKWGQL